MRIALLVTVATLGLQSTASAQVQGVCVSGCNIPTPSPSPAPAPADLSGVFHIERVQQAEGFWLQEAPHAERLPVIGNINLPIRDGGSLITGPGGSARFGLPGNVDVTMGPGTEIAVTHFERTAPDQPASLMLTIVKGFVRWRHAAEQRIRYWSEPRIIVGCCSIGVKGTDVEFSMDPGGSGYVRLYEGEVTYSDLDGGQPTSLRPGQTLRFENFRIVGVQ